MNDIEGRPGRRRPGLRDRPWWKLLISSAVGVLCLVASGVCGVLAVQDFRTERAFDSAVSCGSAQTTTAESCLTDVTATVTGVTEVGGKSSSYRLALDSPAGAVTVSFSDDNAVLDYADDGSAVTAEYWRGRVVSVTGTGGSATTTDAPPLAFARNLGGTLFALGFALYAFLVAWTTREQRGPRRLAPGSLGPLGSFLAILVGVGGLAPMGVGWYLLQHPQSLDGALVTGGCALAGCAGLAGWGATAVHRRRRREAARRARAAVAPPAAPTTTPGQATRIPELGSEIVLLARPTRRQRARAVTKGGPRPAFERTRIFGWGGTVLFALLFFAALITLNDGPSMRAYDTAPACPVPATSPGCRGLVPVQVNGVRATANGGEAVDISFTTGDGAVNAWNQFDADALTRRAPQLQQAETVIPAQVWGDRVLGAQLDGTMYWGQGDPPDDSFAAGSLAVLAGLALVLNRVRTRFRHPELSALAGRWLLDDAAQLVLTAAGVWLMAVGIGWGVLPLLGGLGWSQWSVPRAGALRRRRALVPALAPPVAPGRDGAPARIADLAQEALFLDPTDRPTEHTVNSWVFQCPEPGGDGLLAAGTVAELEQLASALQTRIAASGRELSARFVVTVNTRSGRLSCHTVTLSGSELLENDSFEPVDSLTAAVEQWLAGPDPDDPDDESDESADESGEADSGEEQQRSLLWLREVGTVADPG